MHLSAVCSQAPEEKSKSLTAELEADPEFRELMEREPAAATRGRTVTLRPLAAMLNEFDIRATEEQLTSPRTAKEVRW